MYVLFKHRQDGRITLVNDPVHTVGTPQEIVEGRIRQRIEEFKRRPRKDDTNYLNASTTWGRWYVLAMNPQPHERPPDDMADLFRRSVSVEIQVFDVTEVPSPEFSIERVV